MSHIIGRPNDDILDLILGRDADPEQAFIGATEQDPAKGDGYDTPPATPWPCRR